MENLWFAHRSDHEPATLFDDAADAPTEGGPRRSAFNPPQAYRAVSLLDGSERLCCRLRLLRQLQHDFHLK